VALQARMRAWTLLETGIAGTACKGGVAVTVWVVVVVAACATRADRATLPSSTNPAAAMSHLPRAAVPREFIHKQ
jgi:hypothetical protein